MSLMKRISLIFRSKANKALDRAEDPRETLDYSYQRQLELLHEGTPRRRRRRDQPQAGRAPGQPARAAVRPSSRGRRRRPSRWAARTSPARRSPASPGSPTQITDLKAQHAQLQGEEEKLTLAQQRLQAKVEAFRTRKETIKATYTAAEAQTRINEAMSGIGEEMGDVGMAIQRAEDKTAQMQARAGAIDELIASGALDDVSQVGGGDDIARELDAMSSETDVEAELAALKAVRPAAGHRGRRHPVGVAAEHHEPPRSGEQSMIVRILGEGQYDVADEALDRLNESTRRSSPRSRPATRRRSPPPSPRCSTASARSAYRTRSTASTSPT